MLALAVERLINLIVEHMYESVDLSENLEPFVQIL